jgi:hypothetical protein
MSCARTEATFTADLSYGSQASMVGQGFDAKKGIPKDSLVCSVKRF